MRRAYGGAGLQYRQGGSDAPAGNLPEYGKNGHSYNPQAGADGHGGPGHHGKERHCGECGQKR